MNQTCVKKSSIFLLTCAMLGEAVNDSSCPFVIAKHLDKKTAVFNSSAGEAMRNTLARVEVIDTRDNLEII